MTIGAVFFKDTNEEYRLEKSSDMVTIEYIQTEGRTCIEVPLKVFKELVRLADAS